MPKSDSEKPTKPTESTSLLMSPKDQSYYAQSQKELECYLALFCMSAPITFSTGLACYLVSCCHCCLCSECGCDRPQVCCDLAKEVATESYIKHDSGVFGASQNVVVKNKDLTDSIPEKSLSCCWDGVCSAMFWPVDTGRSLLNRLENVKTLLNSPDASLVNAQPR